MSRVGDLRELGVGLVRLGFSVIAVQQLQVDILRNQGRPSHGLSTSCKGHSRETPLFEGVGGVWYPSPLLEAWLQAGC